MLALKIMLGLLLTGVLAVQAEDVVIQSIDQAGRVTFSAVSGATGYRVEWAPVVAGPWTNFAAAAALLDNLPHTGSGMVTCAVPIVYRVVATMTNPPPADMVLIPAGSFVMGNATNVLPPGEGYAAERPQHTVWVSAFYMGKYEVTKAEWDTVHQWATNHGYAFSAGSGKATNHPVQFVSWYDIVKWCNARSEQEGRTPCYTVAGSVYTNGQSAPDCNWTANGYRLPTESEWEKAARGGAPDTRFPWTDYTNNIAHVKANYLAIPADFSYDVNPTEGFHPAYMEGGTPYTSPVGAFAPNGYGLYDMAGNVWEWCWDWCDLNYYAVSPGTDPRGPDSSPYSTRVYRGGSWNGNADYARLSDRFDFYPYIANYDRGFRVVLPWLSSGPAFRSTR